MPAPITPRRPGQPTVGLLAAAPPTVDPLPRWGGGPGYAFSPASCDVSGVGDPCSVDSRTPGARAADVEGNGFFVWAGETCSALDYGGNWEELQQRAVDQLLATQSKRIAEEFWRGTQARESGWSNRYLTHLASDVLSDAGAVSATVGLACLEQYLADVTGGEPGMIHAPRQIVTHWSALGLVKFEGGLVRTVLQTVVVPDAGYDGSGPQDAPNGAPDTPDDGSIWAYATSPVEVRLGPVDAQPAPNSVWEITDRETNDFTVLAQRLAMVTFDACAHAAVELDLPVCGIGGAGS